MVRFILLLCLAIYTQAQNNDSYCRQNSQHTMCQYQGPAPSCFAKSVFRGLSTNTRKAVLDRHNELRSQVALGNQPGQPAAADMNRLVWNTELANIAQRWADQCLSGHPRYNNQLDGTYVGQNFGYSGDSRKRNEDQLTDVAIERVDNWFNEVKKWNPDNISNYRSDGHGQKTGHYTQIVWANTKEIGCGSVYYKEGIFWKYNLVYNYAVGGNIIGASVYKIGQACSGCGDRGCQNGLCCQQIK